LTNQPIKRRKKECEKSLPKLPFFISFKIIYVSIFLSSFIRAQGSTTHFLQLVFFVSEFYIRDVQQHQQQNFFSSQKII